MKTLSIKEIKENIHRLIDGTLSRKDASLWAEKLMLAEDERELIYEPKDLEELIWDSLVFINGIDLELSPGVYLHSIEQIQHWETKLSNK